MGKILDEITQRAERRLNICKECERYNSTLKVCKECNCFMPAKTMLRNTLCPLLKWGPDDG